MPLRLKPAMLLKDWGGHAVHGLFPKESLPGEGAVGEYWELSCHPAGLCRIEGGGLLKDAIDADPVGMLGAEIYRRFGQLPILNKIIDAGQSLSVQVHPGDGYARQHEGAMGKTEAWVVLHARPGAWILYNTLEGERPEEFARAARSGGIRERLRYVYVRPGDVFYIPAGMLHALGAGVVVFEVQQNSDITYRLYDWDKPYNGKMRPLHVDKALDVIRCDLPYRQPVRGLRLDGPEGTRTVFIADENFCLERIDRADGYALPMDGERFYAFTALTKGGLRHPGGALSFRPGETVFVPAACAWAELRGGCSALLTGVPDLDEIRARFGASGGIAGL